MTRSRRRVLFGALLVAVTASSPAGQAYAACNLVPIADQVFPSVLGYVSTPFAQPGQPVAIRRGEPVFQDGAGGNSLRVEFVAAGGTTVLTPALRPASAAEPGNPCRPADCSGGSCRCVWFTFPDTDGFVGGPADGQGLAGPVVLTVETAGAVTARIDSLFFPGTRITDDRLPAFLALPPTNPFVALLQGPGTVLGAPDGAGNLFIPFGYDGVIREEVPITTLVDAAVPGVDRLLGLELDAFTLDGRRLPPLLRSVGPGQVVGSIDAIASVLRVPGGIAVGNFAQVEGKGPIVVPGISGVTDPWKRADALSLETVEGPAGEHWVIYENHECIPTVDLPRDCLDLNGDGDQRDHFLLALRLEPGAQPIVVDQVDTGDVPFLDALPALPQLYTFDASHALVAFSIFHGDPDAPVRLRSGLFDLARGERVTEANGSRNLVVDGTLAAFVVTEPPAFLRRDALAVYDAAGPAPAVVFPGYRSHSRLFVARPLRNADGSARVFDPVANPVGLAVAASRVAFAVDESVGRGEDFDGNGQESAAVFLYAPGDPEATNVGLASAIGDVGLSARSLVVGSFRYEQGLAIPAVYAIDLTPAGASARLICDPGATIPGARITDALLSCGRFEQLGCDAGPLCPDIPSADANGDGDLADLVLQVAPPGGPPLSTGLALADFTPGAERPSTVPAARDGVLAVPVDENANGRDLNGDGLPPFTPGRPSTVGVLYLVNPQRLAAGRPPVVSTNRPLLPLTGGIALKFIDGGLSFLSPECRFASTFDGCRRTLYRDLDRDGSFEELVVDPSTGALVTDDNCPTVPNPDQRDGDGDGIGDACQPLLQPSRCGDGVVEEAEACDGSATATCPDGCIACRCRCLEPIRGRAVAVRRKGRVKAKLVLPLVEYSGATVDVTLADGAGGVRRQALGTLSAVGSRAEPRHFRFVGGRRGVRSLSLRPRRDVTRITLRARRFLDGLGASSSLRLRIDIGNRCVETNVTPR